MHNLVLASKSPRRKLLLEEKGFLFETFSIEVSEILDENLNITEQLEALAQTKALAAAKVFKPIESQNYLFLSADTVVVFKNKVLGKPESASEALATLRRLSGETHQVYTSFCLLELASRQYYCGHDISSVTFRKLSEESLQNYVHSGRCMDKAGSYGIQEVGDLFVENFQGSYENIVGLPVDKVESAICEMGWNVARQSQ